MDTLSPLDAAFLYIEDGLSHMHIGSCAIFEGPAPTFGEMTHLIESKLPQLVRYRQKVRFVPGGLGHPVWVDDAHFDLDNHVGHTVLASPGTEQDLDELMGQLMSHELDRGRPLWEAQIVEGLKNGRWALISKVHHCMVDGLSGIDLLAALLDVDRSAAINPIEPWSPAPEPSGSQLAARAMSKAVTDPVHSVLSWRPESLVPSHVWHHLGEYAEGARSLGARLVSPVKRVSIEGRIGPRRQWATGRCRLSDAKAIRKAFGGSVNDVVLAAISGAFRAVLIDCGDPVDESVVLRTLVPVSVRHLDDHTPNNQVSLLIAELPVSVADPVDRLRAVCTQMAQLKTSHQAAAGAAAISGAQFVPPGLFALGARAAMGVMRRLPQRSVNTVTTNVPGPQFPLYALGREMVECLPFVPLSEGIRIGVAIMSYNGRLSFGVTGDYDMAPDVRFMAEQIEVEMRTLRERARHEPRRPRAARS